MRGQLPPSHIQPLSMSRAATASLVSHQSIPFQNLNFPLSICTPRFSSCLSDQHHRSASLSCLQKKQRGGGNGGSYPCRVTERPLLLISLILNICTALKVTVGNTGKSSCLVFLPDSREFNASSRLGFLSLDRGHHALEGSSSFEGHTG